MHLVDCPGFQVGLRAESSAVIRWGVRALSAINQTTVPWCSVIVRNCYGVGGLGHQPVGHLCLRYAWPSASWGSLPLEGGIEAAYRAEIDAAADPQAKLEEIEERLNRLRSPFRTAEAFWVDEVIDPRDTRRCCAISPTWRRRCASRVRPDSGCGPDSGGGGIGTRGAVGLSSLHARSSHRCTSIAGMAASR